MPMTDADKKELGDFLDSRDAAKQKAADDAAAAKKKADDDAAAAEAAKKPKGFLDQLFSK